MDTAKQVVQERAAIATERLRRDNAKSQRHSKAKAIVALLLYPRSPLSINRLRELGSTLASV